MIGVFLGILLAAWVACFTLFNDTIIRQPLMTGNLMPSTVYGLLVVLSLLAGAWVMLRRGRGGMPRQHLVMLVVIATAACAWPGSNFYRTFVGGLANPINLERTKPHWQSEGVLSYVPGGSPTIARGQVRDWRGLAQQIHHTISAEPPNDWGAWLNKQLLAGQRRLIRQLATDRDAEDEVRPDERATLLAALNHLVRSEGLADHLPPETAQRPEVAALIHAYQTEHAASLARLNRALLAVVWPEHVAPIPAGEGVMVNGAEADPVVTDALVGGVAGEQRLSLGNVPWRSWWPTLRLWVGLAALLAVASVCLALILHPQWSRYERLPYPLVKLVEAVTSPTAVRPGGLFHNKLFWGALLAVLVLHLNNGLAVWQPGWIKLPLTYDLSPLMVLFPNASRVSGSWNVFHPHLYLSVIAFAFFVRTDVTLSMGIVGFAWLALGAALTANAIPLTNNQAEADIGPLLRIGAYLGYAVMIFYFGRRHYLAVAADTLRLRRVTGDPNQRTLAWAGRLLVLSSIGCVVLLSRYGGLDWRMGVIAVALILLMLVVLARIFAETGAFYIQPNWMPITFFAAVFGFEGMGPTTFLMISLIGVVLVGDPRESILGFFVNGLKLSDDLTKVSRRSSALLQGSVALGALVLAGAVTLMLLYTWGLPPLEKWANEWHPSLAFNTLARRVSDAMSVGELDAAVGVDLSHAYFSSMRPDWPAVGIMAGGAAAVIALAAARMRLPWWPIHPVLLLVIGTTPAGRFAWSFLLGWFIKSTITRLTGARGYSTVRPLMIGLIAGELLAALFWQSFGAAYYAITGALPETYFILPN